jgi:hypothetical protein
MSLDDQDKQWISEQLERIRLDERQWISEPLERMRLSERQWISEQLEGLETKLLTEFHKWASATDARQRTHAAAIRAMDVEMEAFDDRLKKLEGRQ